jgi:hypothetical protein
MYEIKNYHAVVDQANAMVDQIDPANGLIHRVTFGMSIPSAVTNFAPNLAPYQERVGEQLSWIYNIVGAKAKLIRRVATKSMLFTTNGTRSSLHLLVSEFEVEFSNPEFMMAWTKDARRALLAFSRALQSLRVEYDDNEDYNALANLVHNMLNASQAPWFTCDGDCEEGETYASILLDHCKQRNNEAIQNILARINKMEDRAFFNTDMGGDLVAEDGAPIRAWVLNRARYFELLFTTFTHRCIGVKGTPIKPAVCDGVDPQFDKQ